MLLRGQSTHTRTTTKRYKSLRSLYWTRRTFFARCPSKDPTTDLSGNLYLKTSESVPSSSSSGSPLSGVESLRPAVLHRMVSLTWRDFWLPWGMRPREASTAGRTFSKSSLYRNNEDSPHKTSVWFTHTVNWPNLLLKWQWISKSFSSQVSLFLDFKATCMSQLLLIWSSQDMRRTFQKGIWYLLLYILIGTLVT